MTGKKIRVERQEDRMEFAKFMRGNRVMEFTMKMENPITGDVFELPIVYEPATAFDVAEIYADLDKNASTEEQFERTMEIFNICVKNVKFVNTPRGMANYEAGEISMQDLTLEQKQMIEKEVIPGVGKSPEQLEQELKASRRQVGKGGRRKVAPRVVDAPDARDVV